MVVILNDFVRIESAELYVGKAFVESKWVYSSANFNHKKSETTIILPSPIPDKLLEHLPEQFDIAVHFPDGSLVGTGIYSKNKLEVIGRLQ